jgi:hypothetical protein
MPIRLDGMSEVTRNLEQLKNSLDGEIAGLKFDPLIPEEVQRAIRLIKMKVDMKLAPYITSPGVQEIATGLKQEVEQAILQKAAEARKVSPS